MNCPRCGHTNPEGTGVCAGCEIPLSGDRIPPNGIVDSSGPEGRQPPSGGDPNFTRTIGIEPPASLGEKDLPFETLRLGRCLGNRYEIVSVLGRGGMGVVYRARDLTLGRDVALKVIRPDMSRRKSVIMRFRREILLASKITHKNILRIHDLGESDGLAYISMNYVEGETLEDLLKREGPLPPDRAIPLAIQICRALEAAHEAGVVHRDLKPQNILLDREGNAFIADFGLSRSLEHGGTMTQAGVIIGTLKYMSPEQARGEKHDHRGDIYAFGLILFEMVTGENPFRADSAISSLMKRVHEEAPKASQIRQTVKGWLSAIISRALQRTPEARYQSATEILRDLEARHAWMARRRMLRPRFLIPAATVLFVLIVAVAGGITGMRYILRQREAAVIVPTPSLVLLPFQNATGDPDFDWAQTGLPSLVSNDLQSTGGTRLLRADRIQQTLGHLKLPLTGSYTPFDLKRIASVLGAEILVTGVIRREEDQFFVGARLQRPAHPDSEDVAIPVVQGRGEDSIFALADSMAEMITSALEVQTAQGREPWQPPTRSMKALRLYSEGLDLAHGEEDAEAANRLEGAVEEDPHFSLAHAQLSLIYSRLGQEDRAVASSEQAMINMDTVSDFDANLIRAQHAVLGNQPEVAIAAFQNLLGSYPQSVDVRLELAALLEERGDLAEAAGELEKCIAIDSQHTSARFNLGTIRHRLGEYEVAMKIFSELLGVYTLASDDAGRGEVLNALGVVQLQVGEYGDALDYYRQSLEIGKRIGEPRTMARALLNIAIVLRVQGEYPVAIASAQEGLDLYTQIGDKRKIAWAWTTLGEIHEDAGEFQDAQSCYKESLKIVRDLGDPYFLASVSSNLGYISSILGDFGQAYLLYQDALAKRRQIGDQSDVLRSLIELQLIEQWQGRYDQAMKYTNEAKLLVQEIGETVSGVALAINVGMIYDDQGSYAAAIESLEEALGGARRMEHKYMLASALSSLGGVLTHLGELEGAQIHLDEAEHLVNEIQSAALMPEILIHRAEHECGRRDTARCLKTLASALRQAKSLGDRRQILLTRLNLGRWSLAAGDSGGSAQLISVAKESEDTNLRPLELRAWSYLAFFDSDGPPSAAMTTAARRVLEQGKSLKLRESLILACWAVARAAAAGGDSAEAKRMFLQAGDLVREMTQGLKEPYRTALLGREDLSHLLEEAVAYITQHGDQAEKDAIAAAFARPQS